MKRVHFNELAEIYRLERTEKNFNKLYMELRNVGTAYRVGLTVDDDDYESITTDIAMKLKNNFDDLHQQQKSLLSYCIVCYKSKYYSLLKKYNRYVRQSDLLGGGSDEEDSSSLFDKIIHDNSENIDCDMELFPQNSTSSKLDRFYQIMEDMYQDDIDLMRDIFTPREDIETNNSFVWQSPESIAEKHGIKGRTTVSAKRTRAVAKIRAILEQEQNFLETLDTYGGTKECITPDGTKVVVENNRICRLEKIKNDGTKIVIERPNQKEEIHTTYYPNGFIKEKGIKVGNKRVGKWLFYHDNGNVEGNIDYDNEMRFVLIDRKGEGEAIGKFK
jgi:DNA-directed RNA polymerase specialized sigma24 family protein